MPSPIKDQEIVNHFWAPSKLVGPAVGGTIVLFTCSATVSSSGLVIHEHCDSYRVTSPGLGGADAQPRLAMAKKNYKD